MISSQPRSSLLALVLVALSAVLVSSFASINVYPDGNIVVLNNFGSSSATVYVVSTSSEMLTVSDDPLYDVVSISPPSPSSSPTNYTVELEMNNGVGSAPITFTTGTESVTVNVIVAGFDLLDSDGNIVSGEDNSFTVGQTGSYNLGVRAVNIDGNSIDVSSTAISVRSAQIPYMKEVNEVGTKFTSTGFTLELNSYRLGYGTFHLDFLNSQISLDMESFETILNVNQDVSSPPCVVKAGVYEIEDGRVAVPFYSLLTPPQDSPISTVVMSVGGETVEWDMSMSSLTNPTQIVIFSAPATGEASFTCDGEPAVVVDGDSVEITGSPSTPSTSAPTTSSPSGPLASGIVTDLEEQSGYDQLTAEIIVKNSSVATLLASDAQQILGAFCTLVNGEDCALIDLVDGSAVCTMAANVDPDELEQAESDLTSSFTDCSFQSSLGYGCNGDPDGMELGSIEQKAVGGAAIPTATGLATWLVVLIACVGALALVSLMMVGLLAVYRRSAEQSESDYSSSGPLGVPDPSDLLYEQSIVRDIYGRGDFPEGGPSAQVAADRERIVNLREEVPRPPSSNSLTSRASDISSTYSV